MEEVIASKYEHLHTDFEGTVVFDNYTTKVVPYDEEYLENYRIMADTLMGHKLTAFRKAYAEGFLTSDRGKLLDFGCGFSPICEGIEFDTGALGTWYGCDINPLVAELSHMFDCYDAKPNLSHYEVICFFDVIEHLKNYEEILSTVEPGTAVILTVPVMPTPSITENEFEDLVQWRHWKPGEHVIYATVEGWVYLMEACGFELKDYSFYETVMGRQDSCTYAFVKKGTEPDA